MTNDHASDDLKNPPFVKTDQIVQWYNVGKFGSTPIKELLDAVPIPSVPSVVEPFHEWGDLAVQIGGKPSELEILINFAGMRLANDPYIMSKFKEIAIMARLKTDLETDKLIQDDRRLQARIREELINRDKTYQAKLREHKNECASIAEHHKKAGDSLLKGWATIVRSLVSLQRKFPDLTTAARNDIVLLEYLAGLGKVEIVGRWLKCINEDGLLNFSRDDIHAVFKYLDDTLDPRIGIG